MLVLSRKKDQTIRIGSDIVITVVAISGGHIRLGISAPPEVKILRGELSQVIPADSNSSAVGPLQANPQPAVHLAT